MRKLMFTALLIALFAPLSFAAGYYDDDDESDYGSWSWGFYGGVDLIGTTVSYTDVGAPYTKDRADSGSFGRGFGFNLGITQNFRSFSMGLEGFYSLLTDSAKFSKGSGSGSQLDYNIIQRGVNLMSYYRIGRFSPFLLLGAAYATIEREWDSKDSVFPSASQSYDGTLIKVGLGTRIHIYSYWSLRLGANYNLFPTNPYIDNSIDFSLGARLTF